MARGSSFMTRTPKWAAYVCVGTSLGLVLLLGAWAAYYDVSQARASRLRSEIGRLRSHAERSAGHLESQLSEAGPGAGLAEASRSLWLRDHWRRMRTRQPERLYAAVVDPAGRVVAHSQASYEGRQLDKSRLGPAIGDSADGAHVRTDPALSAGQRAVDVRVPILSAGRQVGAYYSGLNADWLDEMLAADTRHKLWEWAGVIGGITLVVLLSSLSLYWITRQTTKLEDALELAEARRVSEMSQLVIGLAHEIRNPLNAMRINLHTLERVHRGDASLAPAEVTAMLHESAREIERMEELMRNVLGYARTASTGAATVDLAEEVRAAVAFLKQKLERSEIRAAVSVPEASVPLHTDPARLRQILLNLVANACEALGPGGQITIGVQRLRDRLELTVADDGPGIAPQHRPRIFEPFFSTKPEGTGLGLALVRKFVEEAGGAVDYKPNPAGHGSLFRVWWPRRETEESGE